MSYVELMVVLAIFSIMSGVVLFNYQNFQHQVEIKSLSNDIALKIVEAQKSAMSGQLAPPKQMEQAIANWKPSYGLYFSVNTNDRFIYFVDLNNSALSPDLDNPSYNFQAYDLSTAKCAGLECLDQIILKKGYTIDSPIIICNIDGSEVEMPGDLSITFTRPDSSAYIQSPDIQPPGASSCPTSQISRAIINITSSNQTQAQITVYPSGRIQIN